MMKKINVTQLFLALLILAIGFFSGYLVHNPHQSKPPTPQQIEQTKNEIAKLYQGRTVPACWTVNNGADLGNGKYELNYRHLRINGKLNRAIITDCGEYDTLLYKNKSGQWIETSVNIALFNRVNPVWQKACGIEDITIADDKVRPENSSIDEANLQQCKQIAQR